jgi:hypothetical protein
MRRALLTLIVAGIAAGVPAASVGSPHMSVSTHFKGVVIARIRAQHALVVASASGHTRVLRATSLPAVGSVVSVSTTLKVTNGALDASKLKVVGHARHARFAAFLVRSVGHLQFFAVGHSLLVAHSTPRTHMGSRTDAKRSVASAKASTLAPGQAAVVQVAITSSGTLDETQVTPMEEPGSPTVTLLVTITAVTPATATAPGSITLTISGQALTLPLAAGTVLPSGFAAGASVELTVVLSSAGGVTTTTTTTTTPTTTTPTASTTTTTTTSTTPTTPTTTTTTMTTTTSPCVDNDGDFDDTGCATTTQPQTGPCTDKDGDFDDTGCAMTQPQTGPCTDKDGDFDDTGCAMTQPQTGPCTDKDGDRDDTGCMTGGGGENSGGFFGSGSSGHRSGGDSSFPGGGGGDD